MFEAERDETWRKRIKNEYVRRIVARELAEASKARKEDVGEGEDFMTLMLQASIAEGQWLSPATAS